MSDTWGMDLNGGPDHIGKCPYCGKSNGDCYDYPHEKCIPLIKCPECGTHVEELTCGVCIVCFETVEP